MRRSWRRCPLGSSRARAARIAQDSRGTLTCAVVLERIATANPDCVIALPPSGL
ncbi:MAG TPA: hypothetical protein VHO07_25665 [Streptosporangiaceae bacterium]|jgi:hypothetical protein|nr:hypothetical protein [Streptosporangiaceae bacterium]